MWNLYDFLRTWAFKESLSVQVDNFKLYSHAFLFSSPVKTIIDTLASFFRKETDHFHSSIIHSVVDSQYSVNPLLYMKCPDLHRFSMRQTWILFKVIIKVIIQSKLLNMLFMTELSSSLGQSFFSPCLLQFIQIVFLNHKKTMLYTRKDRSRANLVAEWESKTTK